MPWSKFVSTEYEDEEKLDAVLPIAMPDKPKYPYGLRICLDEETIKKLEKVGFTLDGCTVGAMIDLRAMCSVTSVACDDTEKGQRRRVELQITELALENEDTEETPKPKRKMFREAMYDRSKAKDET